MFRISGGEIIFASWSLSCGEICSSEVWNGFKWSESRLVLSTGRPRLLRKTGWCQWLSGLQHHPMRSLGSIVASGSRDPDRNGGMDQGPETRLLQFCAWSYPDPTDWGLLWYICVGYRRFGLLSLLVFVSTAASTSPVILRLIEARAHRQLDPVAYQQVVSDCKGKLFSRLACFKTFREDRGRLAAGW